MTDLFQQATTAVEYIRTLSPLTPGVGVILGSGLGAFAENIEQAIAIPYADIPHFPQSTVQSHAGRLILGTIAGIAVAVSAGRFSRLNAVVKYLEASQDMGGVDDDTPWISETQSLRIAYPTPEREAVFFVGRSAA